MLLNNDEIISLCTGDSPMLTPFVDYKVNKSEWNKPIVSYGLGESGYDIRLDHICETKHNDENDQPQWDWGSVAVLDLKQPSTYEQVKIEPHFDTEKGRGVILAPGESVLGVSKEYFRMPTNVKAFCTGKSTYARVHIVPHVTPIEPGWHGYLTIELVNLSSYHNVLYLDEGIIQINFHWLSKHSQYEGKYQGQYEKRPYKACETPKL